jgi:hypothetical protein
MSKLNTPAAIFAEWELFQVDEDFHTYVDTQVWTKAGTGSTIAPSGGAGGIMSLATGSTANNLANITTTNTQLKFLKNQPIYFECYAQYTEAATNQAAVAIGLTSVTSTILADTTGALVGTFTGAVFYKTTGSTVWSVACSNGTTQTITVTDQTSQPTGAVYQRLAIEIHDIDGLNVEIAYFIDGVQVTDNVNHRPVKHTAAIASAAAMKVNLFVKNLAGTTVETLLVDYVKYCQRRTNT